MVVGAMGFGDDGASDGGSRQQWYLVGGGGTYTGDEGGDYSVVCF